MSYSFTIDGRTIYSEELDDIIAVVHHLRTENLAEIQTLRERIVAADTRVAELEAKVNPVEPPFNFHQLVAERNAAFEARDRALLELSEVRQAFIRKTGERAPELAKRRRKAKP